MKKSKNEKNVILSVVGKTTAAPGEEEDVVRLVTTGTLREEEDGSFTLSYEETEPDSQTGQQIKLSLRPGRVAMERAGAYAASMVFEKDKRFEGRYETPFGALDMGVFATRVSFTQEDGQGEVHLQYQLDLQGRYAAMHEMTVRFAPNA